MLKTDEKTLALWDKIDSLKKELSENIEKFDNELNKAVSDIDNGMTSCRLECTNPILTERLIRIDEFVKTWGSISNGIRCLL